MNAHAAKKRVHGVEGALNVENQSQKRKLWQEICAQPHLNPPIVRVYGKEGMREVVLNTPSSGVFEFFGMVLGVGE